MGIIFDEPKYPVLDKAPRFWQTGATSPRAQPHPTVSGAPTCLGPTWLLRAPHLRFSRCMSCDPKEQRQHGQD